MIIIFGIYGKKYDENFMYNLTASAAHFGTHFWVKTQQAIH